MKKVQGVKDLLKYLHSVDFPMTEEQVNDCIAKRTIPHSQSYADVIFFELKHIDWWILEQRQLKNKN